MCIISPCTRLMASARSSCVTVVVPEVKWAPSTHLANSHGGVGECCLSAWTIGNGHAPRLPKRLLVRIEDHAQQQESIDVRKPRELEAVRPVDQWDTELPEDQEDVIPSMELHEVQIAQQGEDISVVPAILRQQSYLAAPFPSMLPRKKVILGIRKDNATMPSHSCAKRWLPRRSCPSIVAHFHMLDQHSTWALLWAAAESRDQGSSFPIQEE